MKISHVSRQQGGGGINTSSSPSWSINDLELTLYFRGVKERVPPPPYNLPPPALHLRSNGRIGTGCSRKKNVISKIALRSVPRLVVD